MDLVEATATPNKRTKPRLRGVSHEFTFYFGLVGAALLIATAPEGRERAAAIIYSLCFLSLFGVSALYHRPMWGDRARAILRRVDHSAIFLLIAGTYTPIALLAAGPESGDRLLTTVWIGAVIGVAKSIAWSHSPRALTAGLYVLLGWAVVMEWGAVSAGIGDVGVQLLLGGGALYSLGAIVYALRRPDPFPSVFGYHEIFHLFVVAAAGLHALLIVRLLG